MATPDNWQMPSVEVGMMVQHFAQPMSVPAAAVVTAVGDRTVELAVWHPKAASPQPLDGVRHKTDPDERAIRNTGVGMWDFVPGSTAELLGRIEHLEATADCLQAQIDELQQLSAPTLSDRAKSEPAKKK